MIIAVSALLVTCRRSPDTLARVGANNVLRVAVVPAHLPPDARTAGIAPFERALIARFAGTLGARFDIRALPSQRAVQDAVDNDTVDFGLVRQGVGAEPMRTRRSPLISKSQLVVVTAGDGQSPRKLADLSGKLVLSGKRQLSGWLARRYPELDFRVQHRANTSELVVAVAQGDIGATIITRERYRRYRRFFASLRQAFVLPGRGQGLYWLFPEDAVNDDTLYYRAIAFIAKQKSGHKIDKLKSRHMTHGADLDAFSIRAFSRHFGDRLPRWRPDFEQAAKRYGIDWRLLAAISYQESRWRQHAVSPTGVRGLMMLTRSTAAAVGIDNRVDPQQSIDGGALYYLQLKKRLPAEIAPPDRKWFALAAYNVGLGHVMDARRLLKRRDEDPDLWVNLKKALQWLTQARYARHASNGRALGNQAVDYVTHIRAYYDILRWDTRQNIVQTKPVAAQSATPDAGENTVDRADQSPVAPIRSPMF